MPATCEVCSSEPSKYRCPTCGTMSCSLACTQSHKIYCAPKAPQESEQKPLPAATDTQSAQGAANGHVPEPATGRNNDTPTLEALASSQELKNLFTRYPSLRSRLRDIYRSTLEEEWVESQDFSGRGRWKGGRHRNTTGTRGPWTAEKGFNRGLGRVRKWRQSCEEGESTGVDAEAFMKFVALVTGEGLPES
ncbi:hypothetical protein VTN02DRAFT_4800 [Thermoascus thermophilus]